MFVMNETGSTCSKLNTFHNKVTSLHKDIFQGFVIEGDGMINEDFTDDSEIFLLDKSFVYNNEVEVLTEAEDADLEENIAIVNLEETAEVFNPAQAVEVLNLEVAVETAEVLHLEKSADVPCPEEINEKVVTLWKKIGK